jgi:hypothetical protein
MLLPLIAAHVAKHRTVEEEQNLVIGEEPLHHALAILRSEVLLRDEWGPPATASGCDAGEHRALPSLPSRRAAPRVIDALHEELLQRLLLHRAIRVLQPQRLRRLALSLKLSSELINDAAVARQEDRRLGSVCGRGGR